MQILTTTDNNRHIFERQTLQEKKQKKLPTHEKILMPKHIAHICLCLLSHKPNQSQKSAIANALSTPNITFDQKIFSMKNIFIALISLTVLLTSCGGSKCKVDKVMCEANGLDENYCPKVDTTITPLDKPSIKKINIFFDASGSMLGFMPTAKPTTELQILIPDIISKLRENASYIVTFYPIYNTNSPMKPMDAKEAEKKIIFGNLVKNGGDTYLPTMLDSVYKSYFSPDAVNIFISDCIYSPKTTEKKQADQATKEIRTTIAPFTKDYFTAAFCLFSKFNKIENSPYYLIVFGKPENNHVIENLVSTSIKNKGQKFEQINFGLKYNQPYYSVLPYTDHSSNCTPNPCDNHNGAFANVSVQDWHDEGDSTSFWIGVNLKDYPSYATTQSYLDSNLTLSIQKGTAKILSITNTPPKELNKDDKTIADNSNYFIHVRVSELQDCATTLHLSLKYSSPKWVDALNYDGDVESNSQVTKGLKKMMDGFNEAYSQNNAYFFNSLNVSLIKQ